jgi:hypothetical protein
MTVSYLIFVSFASFVVSHFSNGQRGTTKTTKDPARLFAGTENEQNADRTNATTDEKGEH